MNGIENSHPSRWKKFALMVVLGVFIAVILFAIFPNKPRVVPQRPPVTPSIQLTPPSLSGMWENSDGDLMELTQNGDEVRVRLIKSDRIVSGDGVLRISGDSLDGVLTALFDGAIIRRKGDFNGRIIGTDLIEYTVPGGSAIQRHSASMRRVDNAPRGGIFGKVVAVTDGDTITILTAENTEVKIRLNGIDAPEKEQPFGTRSKEQLSILVAGKVVRIVSHGEDRYGRTIGDVYVRMEQPGNSAGETHVNLMMVAKGYAWHYVQYAPKNGLLAITQYGAKESKLGLWSDPNPIAPWDWRK
jgi:micrococcal nuclease